MELAARPNPDGLVVRHVFSLESTRQTLQADLGRDLTEAERERHRDEARAIAVTAERDEAMRTMEAGARRQTLDNHQ